MLAFEKILSSFLSFSGLLWLVWLIVTIYLFRKGSSTALYLLSLIFLIVIYVLFTSIGSSFLVIPLENMFAENQVDMDIIKNHGKFPIVVLGGGINYGDDFAELSPYSLQRLVKGYQLYSGLETPIIVSGGIAIGQDRIGEAELASEWLQKMGVPPEDIFIENRARTTYENGICVKEIFLSNKSLKKLASEGSVMKVYLVTNAVHLPRSVLVFEEIGIEAVPVSAGYIVNHRMSWLDYLPNRSSLAANLMGLHEWMGIIWYKVTGRI